MIQEKIKTIDEQIKFIHDTRRFLESNPETEVQILNNDGSTTMLRAIEENLITTKMWISLPEYHQAAMHILDKAFVLKKDAKLEDFTPEQFWLLLGEMVEEFGSDDYASTFEAVGAVALVAVGKYALTEQKPVEVPTVTAADQELLDLKAWWIRLHQDVMADDFEEVRREIRRQVNDLQSDNPGILNDDDKAFFWPELKRTSGTRKDMEVSHG